MNKNIINSYDDDDDDDNDDNDNNNPPRGLWARQGSILF